MIHKLTLPLTDPILIFTVIITIVFFTPILLKKINIPDIIGLILSGVIIGPHGLNLLSGNLALSIFGTIGLLYIMFLAGLEIDLNDLSRRSKEGIVFGIITFIIPFILGFVVMSYLPNSKPETSLLVATMLASHTLVSYPILGRLGILNHKIVTVTIAGTIIADTVVLIILGVISDSATGDLTFVLWMRSFFFFGIFFFYVLYILPKIARWVFKYQASERGVQYVFVLTSIFISATIAEFLLIEPLIGAFFTGLSLNRYIPRTSPLMNRTVFIGNTLFIPFFLISIGMMVDLEILLSDLSNWIIIGALVITALFSKYLAAFITQKIFNYTKTARNLIFGISSARAASAIAIMVVGQEIGYVNESLLNSTIFLILITCLVSSLITQRAGQKFLQIKDSDAKPDVKERIMVSIGNPDNIERLIDFSLLIKNPKSISPLYPITVIPDGHKAEEINTTNKELLRKALEHANAADEKTELITRIDVNIIDGMLRSIKELSITKVVIGWNSNTTTIEKLFGTLLEKLLENTERLLIVAKLESQLGLSGNIHVFVPTDVEQEIGFIELLDSIKNISKHINRRVFFYGNSDSLSSINNYFESDAISCEYIDSEINDFFFKRLSLKGVLLQDMIIFIKVRKNTYSHSKLIDRYPKIIKKYFCYHNLLLMYPEQQIIKKGIFKLYNMN